uniref:Uncharacterized protein n=1 Tax=mine drainage metagenome TaxID=410659 RepID=E6QWR5_9ZZZZ
MPTQAHTNDDAYTAIIEPPLFAFDLHKVEEALRVNHALFSGVALTSDEIQRGVQQYRQFLANHKASGMPEKFEVPSLLVDRVWHTHMCETEQYEADCRTYFGRMFHHRSEICNGNGGEGDDRPLSR